MSDLLRIGQLLVARAGRGEDVEAYITHQRTFQARAFDGEVESVSSAEPMGVGVRVIADERVGFAYTTDLTETGLDDVVDHARSNAAHTTADPHVGLAQKSEAEELSGLFDPAHGQATPDDKVAFALELERIARTNDDRVRTVEDAVYADSESEIAIATSTGVSGSYRRTDAWCYAHVIASEGDDAESGFEFGIARALSSLDARQVATDAASRALDMLGARKIPSTRLPVVLDPSTCAQFLGVIGSVLTGEAIQRGRSLFAGRQGEKVAADVVTLVDDGRVEVAPGAAPWDDEGTATQRTEVLREGVLERLLYDWKSARRDGVSSTGNASRAGYRSLPHPSPSNMTLESTGESAEEVLRRAGRALLVHDFHGVHSGANPITGDFSVGASGVLLEGGEAVHGVKEVTIAAPILDILGGIVAVATDRRWLPFGGSYGGATTLIAEMTIAGS